MTITIESIKARAEELLAERKKACEMPNLKALLVRIAKIQGSEAPDLQTDQSDQSAQALRTIMAKSGLPLVRALVDENGAVIDAIDAQLDEVFGKGKKKRMSLFMDIALAEAKVAACKEGTATEIELVEAEVELQKLMTELDCSSNAPQWCGIVEILAGIALNFLDGLGEDATKDDVLAALTPMGEAVIMAFRERQIEKDLNEVAQKLKDGTLGLHEIAQLRFSKPDVFAKLMEMVRPSDGEPGEEGDRDGTSDDGGTGDRVPETSSAWAGAASTDE